MARRRLLTRHRDFAQDDECDDTDAIVEQTPSLPDSDPRSGRPRCDGRESKWLAASDHHSPALRVGEGSIPV